MMLELFHLYFWQDIVEIIMIATVLYRISRWLALDKQKNLVLPLYLYCICIIACSIMQCSTLSMLLITYAPVAMVIVFLVHQQQLQKNFVILSRLEPAKEVAQKIDWLDSFLRACVISFNKQKNISVIIEHKDYLAELLHLDYRIETNIENGILELLIDSPLINNASYMWINADGTLKGINAQLLPTAIAHLPAVAPREQRSSSNEALIITGITDALIVKTDAVTREFDIFVQGKQYSRLSTNAALALLKKYFLANRQDQSGVSYAASYKKTTDHSSAS